MLFSVIIPAYNREKEIKRAVDSVLSQTLQDFEVIVVDDGSTDQTGAIVQSINDSRIVYVRQDNRGATAARNNGVRHAKGIYISFLDSDDIWYSNTLERQLWKFNSDKEISCVYSDLNIIKPGGQIMPFWKPTKIEGYIYKEALTQGYLSPMIVLSVKKSCIEAVGMFDEGLPASQDDDICFKLAKKYKFGFVSDQLAGVYTDVNNRISGSSKRVSMGWWMLWNKYEDDVVNFCGKEVMAAHYFNCLYLFLKNKDYEMINKAKAKYLTFGSLNLFQVGLIYMSLHSPRLFNKIFRRLLYFVTKKK